MSSVVDDVTLVATSRSLPCDPLYLTIRFVYYFKYWSKISNTVERVSVRDFLSSFQCNYWGIITPHYITALSDNKRLVLQFLIAAFISYYLIEFPYVIYAKDVIIRNQIIQKPKLSH